MKKLLISVFAVAAIVSCKKTVVGSTEDYGYLNIDISSDTEMTVVTKAEELTDAEAAGYNVTLLNEETGVPETKEYSEMSSSNWKVAPGTYTVTVENLTAEEAMPASDKGTVRLADTKTGVVVHSGVDVPVELTCRPINSRVTVDYDETFGAVFLEPQLSLTGAGRTFNMAWGHDEANGVYYSGGVDLTWKLDAKLSGDNTQKSYPSLAPIKTQAGKWTQITFSISSTDGSLKVSIKVEDEFVETVQVTERIDPFSGN